ncbi:MAG: MmcQ/YjbR family DNA-binding protein [Actinomycetota bacterium]|nr:MmcQ/YjbR family DNA-binding protein [Actinomycetota bacterium]
MAARRVDHHRVDHHGVALQELRRICGELPEVTERLSHGSPTFFIRDKQTLCTLLDNHHGAHGLAIWAPAPKGVQEQLVEAEPERFFRPPYVGGRGWIGLRLDIEPDWDEVASILDDAYRLIAPKKLGSQLPPRGER